MQPNIGLLDRYVRVVTGLVIYGSGLQRQRGSAMARGALLSIGAMKIAEGVTGWCPLMHVSGLNTRDTQGRSTSNSKDEATSKTQDRHQTQTNAPRSPRTDEAQQPFPDFPRSTQH